MQLTNLFLLLIPTLALGFAVDLDKRAYVTCTLTGSDVKYHVKPDASSGAPGQFGAKGSKVNIVCDCEGMPYKGFVWLKDTVGSYVMGYYVNCSAVPPSCPEIGVSCS